MTENVADLAVRLAQNLPAADLDALARGAERGRDGLIEIRSRTASPIVRAACDDLLAIAREPPSYVAGTLAGAAAAVAVNRRDHIEIVWTGPESDVDTTRLTAAVIIELVDEARQELLLVSYATYSEPRVTAAVSDALARGVNVTVLLERAVDNPNYLGQGHPFPGLPIRRLAWLPNYRPAGAALHAKLIVVDAAVALIGSANLTGRAMDTNLECGVLLRGGGQPQLIRDHIFGLLRRGCLYRLPETG
ncbi:MAG TPA: DISARM system phospholipase D-like protein DrmC [Acidimicrobiales bacterium]|nr:DISARM system phospholipase D-like protein DrmC [Acidimicrobiales bacterium]